MACGPPVQIDIVWPKAPRWRQAQKVDSDEVGPIFPFLRPFLLCHEGWEDKDEDLARGSVPRQERGGGCIVRRAGLVRFENRRPRLAPAGSGGGRPRCRGRDARLRPIEVQADYRRSEVKRFRFTTANRP